MPKKPPAQPPTQTDPAAVATLLQRLMSLMSQRAAGEPLSIMIKSGLTMPQMVALYHLEATGPCSVTKLAGHLALSKAATSHMVERLLLRQLVARTESETDRRVKTVSLSPGGAAFVLRLSGARTLALANVAGSFSPEVLVRLRVALANAVEELEPQCACRRRVAKEKQTKGRT